MAIKKIPGLRHFTFQTWMFFLYVILSLGQTAEYSCKDVILEYVSDTTSFDTLLL